MRNPRFIALPVRLLGPTAPLAASLIATLTASPAAPLAAQPPRSVHHLGVPLADLSIAADTVSGLAVIMQPSGRSKQAKSQDAGFVWLRFHPDSAIEWLNSAVAAIRTPVAGDAAEGIQWSRSLRPLDGKGAMAVGRARKKGVLQKTHWLAIADSVTGWRFELSGREADSLLQLMLAAGSQSRVDSAAAALEESTVEVPVRILDQPALTRRGWFGRVLVEFVVGVDGRAEPESFVAYLASEPRLVAPAREMIMASRFVPAQRGGRPVRQRVRQGLAWIP
jgi:hypothetical protein